MASTIWTVPRGWGVPRAGAHELHDLAAALLGALHARVDLLRAQSRSVMGMPVHAGEAGQRHHVVAVPAQQQALDVLDASTELHREERLVAGHVQRAAWPITRCVGNPVTFHAVYTIASSGLLTTITIVRGELRDLLAHVLHDPHVDLDQVVAAHARLARQARGDDHHVGAARCPRSRSCRGCSRRSPRSARSTPGPAPCPSRHPSLGDVQQDDVAEFLGCSPVGTASRRRCRRR